MNIDLLIDYLLRVFSFDENSPLLFTQMHFWVFFCIVFAGFAMMQKNVEKALSAAREAFRKISGSSKELGQMKIMQICPGFSCAACGRQVAG